MQRSSQHREPEERECPGQGTAGSLEGVGQGNFLDNWVGPKYPASWKLVFCLKLSEKGSFSGTEAKFEGG